MLKPSLALLWVVGVACLVVSVSGMTLEADRESEKALEEQRILGPVFVGQGGGINISQFTFITALLAAAFASLLGITCIGLLLIHLLNQDDEEGYGETSSYSSSYRRLFDNHLDWEKVSIIEWLEVGSEVWATYDPTNIECQKRAVCELFQNRASFGPAADMLIEYFSYLDYAKVFSLPDALSKMADEYLDAIDVGKHLLKEDCGDVFSSCNFSLKRIMQKHYHPIHNAVKRDVSIDRSPLALKPTRERKKVQK